jgi:hypothetical protein
MRLLTASLTACSAVFVLAGCGGERKAGPEPRIEPVTAQQLATMSEEVADLAGNDECAAAERADDLYNAAVEARDAGSVPERLAPEVVARAEELRNELNCPPPPPPPTTTDEDDDDRGNGKGKGKGKGKGGGKHGGDED